MAQSFDAQQFLNDLTPQQGQASSFEDTQVDEAGVFDVNAFLNDITPVATANDNADQQKDGVLSSFGKSIANTGNRSLEAIGGVAEMAGRQFGSEALTDTGYYLGEGASDEVKANAPNPDGEIAQFAADVGQGVGDLGLAIATFNPIAAGAVMTANVGGHTYRDYQTKLLAKGLDRDQAHEVARNAAVFKGIAEGVTELIPAISILKRGGALTKRLTEAGLTEAAQEALMSTVEQTYDATQLKDMTLGDAVKNIDWSQVAYSGLVGGTVGTVVAGGTHPFVKKEEEDTPPDDFESQLDNGDNFTPPPNNAGTPPARVDAAVKTVEENATAVSDALDQHAQANTPIADDFNPMPLSDADRAEIQAGIQQGSDALQQGQLDPDTGEIYASAINDAQGYGLDEQLTQQYADLAAQNAQLGQNNEPLQQPQSAGAKAEVSPAPTESAQQPSNIDLTPVDENLLEKARAGDQAAQDQYTNFGLSWDGDKTKYRKVNKNEVDTLLNGENVASNRGHGVTDITDNPDYANVPASSDHRIKFKKTARFDSDVSNDTKEKNKDKGEYHLKNGYSLADVDIIEKRNEKGEWEQVYPNTLDQQANETEPNKPIDAKQNPNKQVDVESIINSYSVSTIDGGDIDVKVVRNVDGSVTLFDESGNNAPIDLKEGFVKGKTDKELLDYEYEPLGVNNISEKTEKPKNTTTPIKPVDNRKPIRQAAEALFNKTYGNNDYYKNNAQAKTDFVEGVIAGANGLSYDLESANDLYALGAKTGRTFKADDYNLSGEEQTIKQGEQKATTLREKIAANKAQKQKDDEANRQTVIADLKAKQVENAKQSEIEAQQLKQQRDSELLQISDSDVIASSGVPFATELSAKRAATINGYQSRDIVPVVASNGDSGFALRQREEAKTTPLDEPFAHIKNDVIIKTELDQQANEAATSANNTTPQPTDAQKQAGNYKKGRVEVNGLKIAIENPKGSIRSGTDRKGKKWAIELQNHYGDISGTKGADGDALDVFLGDRAEDSSLPVFVVNQNNPNSRLFDEHKIMVGFANQQAADAAYLSNYEQGWTGKGETIKLSQDEFKTWLKDGNTTKRLKQPKQQKEAVSKPLKQTVNKPAEKPTTFKPTHELSDGTQVIAVADEPNVWQDIKGDEIEDDSATAIAKGDDAGVRSNPSKHRNRADYVLKDDDALLVDAKGVANSAMDTAKALGKNKEEAINIVKGSTTKGDFQDEVISHISKTSDDTDIKKPVPQNDTTAKTDAKNKNGTHKLPDYTDEQEQAMALMRSVYVTDSGNPYKSEKVALNSMRKSYGIETEVVPIEGGFGIRKPEYYKEPVNEVDIKKPITQVDTVNDKNSFIESSSGTVDFGKIDSDIAKIIGRQAAPIRLQKGEHISNHKGFGLEHINEEHPEVKNALEFVARVAKEFVEIRQNKRGRLSLVAKSKTNELLIVELRPAEDSDYYSVITAHKSRSPKGKLLWSAPQMHSVDPSDQPTSTIEPVAKSGQANRADKLESNAENIKQDSKNSNEKKKQASISITQKLETSKQFEGDYKALGDITIKLETEDEVISNTADVWLKRIDDRLEQINTLRGCMK